MLPAVVSTNTKDGNVEGSPDGVKETASTSAATSTEVSELSAPLVKAEISEAWVDPDEATNPAETKGRQQEVEAAGLDAPNLRPGRVDVQHAVENPADGKQELLYATEVTMKSPRNGGQPISVLAEVSWSWQKRSFVCSTRFLVVVELTDCLPRVLVPPRGVRALGGCAFGRTDTTLGSRLPPLVIGT